MLRKIECFLVPAGLDALRDLLLEKGVDGMSVTGARGLGTRSPKKNGIPQFEEKAKVEIVVDERVVDEIVAGIKRLARRGDLSEGRVFVIPVEDVVKLSPGRSTTVRRRKP